MAVSSYSSTNFILAYFLTLYHTFSITRASTNLPKFLKSNMGTKLQPAIDVLARESFFTVSETKDSMERAFEQRTVEAVKKTMLKQEETFKQQVMELHRLYRVQRMLMDEMRNEMNEQTEYLRATAPSSSQGTVGLGHNFRIQSDNRDEHKMELSRSFSIDRKMESIGFDFGIIHPSIRSIDAGSCSAHPTGLKEDLCGVDLTLSIGGSKNSLKDSHIDQSLGLESSETTKTSHKSRDKEASSSITASSRDNKRSPWGLL